VELKTEIKEIQERVQKLGAQNIPSMFSCLENFRDEKEQNDMIMHLGIFGDMVDCCFFMACVMQKIIETHIPKSVSEEMGLAQVRRMVLSQVESTYMTIQKNKKFELVKEFGKDVKATDIPFVTQLVPKKADDDKPDK
jgi:hypothetical protein